MANLGKVMITHKGTYSPLVNYEKLDCAYHEGSTWLALQPSVGITPVEGSYWTLMAQGVGDEDKNLLFNFNPSVLKIPMMSNFRAWQGVAVNEDKIYVFSDRNDNFNLENIISTYSLDGKLISEKRNAYTETDPNGKFMSFGDGNVIDGYLYVTAYNINDGGTPYISRVIKYTIPGLTISAVYEIGNNIAESVTKHNNYFWVVYHDIPKVRQYDLEFNFIQEYALSTDDAPYGYYQGTLWDGDIFYANLHGHNAIGDEPFGEIRKFAFTGDSFNYIESFSPPLKTCNQGLAYYKGYYFWNDRTNNTIVITKDIKKGRVFPEVLPYMNGTSFKPSLLNGWAGYDPTYDRPARITVNNNIVYVNGIITNPSPNVYNNSTAAFKVPYYLAPKYSLNIPVLTSAGFIRCAIIGRNSSVQANDPSQVGEFKFQNIMSYPEITWVSLDGVNYPILD